jgi:hypothetical protein
MNFSTMNRPGHFSMNLDVSKIIKALHPFCKISIAMDDCTLPITIETSHASLEAAIAHIVAMCLEDVANFVTPPGWLSSNHTMIRRKLHAVIAGLRQKHGLRSTSLAEQGMEALRSTPCTKQCHYDALFAALERLKELEAQQ